MDRLAKLLEDLYSEFDPSSPTHWAKSKPVAEAIEHINGAFERNREEVLALKDYPFGIPMTEDKQRIRHLLHPVVSDLFIPNDIRGSVVDLLENRLMVMGRIYYDEFEKYGKSLAEGKREPIKELDDLNAVHNRIVDRLNKQGCGG